MRILTAVSLVVFTASCLACSREHKGASSSFCIPENHVISQEWTLWGKETAASGVAYAFRGCPADEGACDMPKEIQGGVIEPESNTSWSWDQMPDDAFYKRVLVEGSPEIKTINDNRFAIVINKDFTRDWFIWKLSNIDKSKIGVGKGDYLMAVCSAPSLQLKSNAKTTPAVSCKRYMQGNDYGLTYSFINSSSASPDFQKLDARIQHIIESWRCKKN